MSELREAIEDLADQWDREDERDMSAGWASDRLRRILAEHPEGGADEGTPTVRGMEGHAATTGDEEPECENGPGCTHPDCTPASDVDSDNAAAGGAEGLADEVSLARVVTAQTKSNRWRDLTPLAIARAILASGWLAAHVAQAKAEGRERIAQAMSDEFADRVEWGDGTQYIAVEDAQRIARGES